MNESVNGGFWGGWCWWKAPIQFWFRSFHNQLAPSKQPCVCIITRMGGAAVVTPASHRQPPRLPVMKAQSLQPLFARSSIYHGWWLLGSCLQKGLMPASSRSHLNLFLCFYLTCSPVLSLFCWIHKNKSSKIKYFVCICMLYVVVEVMCNIAHSLLLFDFLQKLDRETMTKSHQYHPLKGWRFTAPAWMKNTMNLILKTELAASPGPPPGAPQPSNSAAALGRRPKWYVYMLTVIILNAFFKVCKSVAFCYFWDFPKELCGSHFCCFFQPADMEDFKNRSVHIFMLRTISFHDLKVRTIKVHMAWNLNDTMSSCF